MFKNFATIILYYHVLKSKLDLPIIIPILFLLGDFIEIFYQSDKLSFWYFMKNLQGISLKLEHYSSFIGAIFVNIYLLVNKLTPNNITYNIFYNYYIISIILYIILFFNQLRLWFKIKI